MIIELLQAATTPQTTVPQTTAISWSVIESIVKTAIIPFCIFIINEQRNTNKRIDLFREEFISIKAILVGADGKNGLRSRIRRMEQKMFNEPHDDEEAS